MGRWVVGALVGLVATSAGLSMPLSTRADGQSPRTLLSVGDSIGAGHGLGPDPNPYAHPPIVNTKANSALVAAKGSYELINLAQSGACVVARHETAPIKADPHTPTGCTRGVAQQLSVAFRHHIDANSMILTVGAEDIRLPECFRFVVGLSGQATSPCSGSQFDTNLAAYAANLHRLFGFIGSTFPDARVMVTNYYNPMPPGNGTNVGTCDLLRVGYIARSPATRLQQQAWNKAVFEKDARQYQTAVYRNLTKTIDRLNAVIADNVNYWDRFFKFRLIDLSTFAGHDTCRQYTRSARRQWEFGPIIKLHATVHRAGQPQRVVSYNVDPGQDCTRTCMAHDPRSTSAQPLKWCNANTSTYSATCAWSADGSPYPTAGGQAEIAHIIEKYVV